VEALEWKRIQTEMELADGLLTVKKCEAVGPQTEVRLTGQGGWKTPFDHSTLGFEGTVNPQPEFMAALKKSIPEAFFPKKTPGKEGYPVKIKGTVGSPDVSFK